ncbi:hypothetical protein BV898_19770, partial [Hypsibius exemplaris]
MTTTTQRQIFVRFDSDLVRLFHFLSWLWVLAVTIGSVYCFYEGVKLMLAEIQKVFPEVGWDSEQAVVIVPGGRINYLTMLYIYSPAIAFATICWTAPSLLLAGIVLAIGYGFRNIQQELKGFSTRSLIKSAHLRQQVCHRMARIQTDHRTLRGCVTTLNHTVSFVVILLTLGDLVMPVSLISRVLQDEPNDPNAKFTNELMKYGVFFFTVCLTVQSVMRIGIFVWMHEKAIAVKVHLHHIGLHGADDAVREAARNFEQEIAEHPEELAVSGNGFTACFFRLNQTLCRER